jgi:hypothetical protein
LTLALTHGAGTRVVLRRELGHNGPGRCARRRQRKRCGQQKGPERRADHARREIMHHDRSSSIPKVARE